jgi:glutamyl-tRNA reductase
VPGEEAVADQVRLALRRAARHQLAGAVMTRLVRSALEAGRLLRDRVRRSTPILELQDLVADLVREHAARWARGKLEGDVILLGSGPVAISIREALIARGIEVTCWATRRPSRRSGPSFTLGEARARASRASAVIAALAGTDQLLDAAILPASSISIDVGVPGNVVGSAWTMSSIIAQAAPRLAPQAEAMRRAAHRIPALAERALAEALAPSVAPVAALVASFRSAVVKAEHDRLAPMLTELPPDVAERVYRSIAHAAARCVHPLHEMVNQLARQGRVHEAVTLVDHLLGTRVGFMDRSMKSADAGSSLRGRRPRRR